MLAGTPHAVRQAALAQRSRRALHPDQLGTGLYLLKQSSAEKTVDHFALLDVGNGLQADWNRLRRPVIVHQTPPAVRADWFENTGEWEILGRVIDETGALARIRIALQTPGYDLFGNNCEHFARFVATGVRESRQVQGFCAVAGLLAVLMIAAG
jgi:hypothetical protein